MTIYVLFLCFMQINRCNQIQSPYPNPFTTIAECEKFKAGYDQNGRATESLARRGMRYVCMKKTVPTFQPAE